MLEIIVFLQLISLACTEGDPLAGRNFTIDYDDNVFVKDGVPFQYIAGSIHYSRVPYYYWKDRLMKMAAAGLDAAQTYVPWNVHEPQPGSYDFTGQENLSNFLVTAQEAGLLVILRSGPYICGEWEYGGLPAWLLSDNASMVVRSMDQKYIAAVDRWMSVLFTYIKPYLYASGGPIIMVQIENEYGSYRSVDCGHDYMAHLHDLARGVLGDDIILFTTDGNAMELLHCGATNDTYATVDFGPTSDVKSAFAPMRQWNPKGPLVNSEFYTGWLDYWKGGHAHSSTEQIVATLQALRVYGASVNMYMFEGGTSFGYMNGADPVFKVCPTSYDYDAPLTEAGDITDKYMAIRNFTSQFKQLPPVLPNSTKAAYGKVTMNPVASVTQLLNVLSPDAPLTSLYPLNMEQSGHYYGFIVYRHIFKTNYMTGPLAVPGIRDRGYVLIDQMSVGMVDRAGSTQLSAFATHGQTLDIVVENQGRVNFGAQINDNKKGILSNVTFNGQVLSHWAMYPLNFTRLFEYLDDSTFKYRQAPSGPYLSSVLQPIIYSANFILSTPTAQDTFLNMCGWFKGQVFMNGFNVGRYWPVAGPQITLYVPAGLLKVPPNTNQIVLVELESAPSSRDPLATNSVEFVDKALLNGRCFDTSTRADRREFMSTNDVPLSRHWNNL